jgi:hypothetical protein
MDLQIISYRDSAPISGVDYRPEAIGLTLDLTGRGFINVTDVLINGVPSPEFAVMSETRIFARIPTTQLERQISTVKVLVSSVGQTGASVISFEVRGGRSEAKGITYIIQTFLMILLSTPGSDIFNPEIGAGLLRLVGTSVQSSSFRAEVSQAVSRTLTQMLTVQAGANIPPEDKLASARLLEASYDPRAASVSVRIQVYSSAGQAADAGVRLSTEASQ